jgi:hypothetical protein
MQKVVDSRPTLLAEKTLKSNRHVRNIKEYLARKMQVIEILHVIAVLFILQFHIPFKTLRNSVK